MFRLYRSSTQSQVWWSAAAEDDSEPGIDLSARFSALVNDGDPSTTAASAAAQLPPMADDWRSLEDYPPSPDSPRYQPFGERMMASPTRAAATARKQPATNGVRSRGFRADAACDGDGRQHGDWTSAVDRLPSCAGDDPRRTADQQHDPQAASAAAAVERLGSFGPWYERTLAAMTNLQRLGSGPLGRPPSGGAGGEMRVAGKLRGVADNHARAPPPPLDRHGLALALLPDPTHVAPYRGAQNLD